MEELDYDSTVISTLVERKNVENRGGMSCVFETVSGATV
jgi:hypothetical protein